MSYLSKVLFLVVFIGLTACKTSPEVDDSSTAGDLSISSAATANSESSDQSQAQAQAAAQDPVVSTADTDSDAVLTEEYTVKAGEFNLYPRETSGWDSGGWSILTPSEDSRLIYVSSSAGDDETAEYYAPRDISDIQAPGLIKPFKTVHAALDQVRDDYPDWILLLRGDTWELVDRVALKSGRSVTERSVITAYGDSGGRPLLKRNE